eukprot:gene9120-9880_t
MLAFTKSRRSLLPAISAIIGLSFSYCEKEKSPETEKKSSKPIDFSTSFEKFEKGCQYLKGVNVNQEYKECKKFKEWYYRVWKKPVRMISLKDFKEFGCCQKYPYHDKYKVLTEDLWRNNLIVFVSHMWYNSIPNNPDDGSNNKHRVIVEGLEKTLKQFAPKFTPETCYIWFDYSSMDQNDCPSGELQELRNIITKADILFTPHYDEVNELPTLAMPMLSNYQSPVWNDQTQHKYGYVNRAWCRVEMMYGTHLDVVDPPKEKRDKLGNAFNALHNLNRRPHVVYFSREKYAQILDPLMGEELLEEYDPKDGALGDEDDRKKICALMDALPKKIVKFGYENDITDGEGKVIFATGAVYEGDFKNGVREGKGKYTHADGEVYEGDYKNGVPEGKGKYTHADGGVYEGDFKNDVREGKGKYTHADGGVYEGDYKNGVKEGKGKYTYADGDVYEGDYKNGVPEGKGKYTYADGNVYEGEVKNGKAYTGRIADKNGKILAECLNGIWKIH